MFKTKIIEKKFSREADLLFQVRPRCQKIADVVDVYQEKNFMPEIL